MTVAAVSLCLILAISILVGRSIDGSLSILQGDLPSELLAIRVPKVLAALAAGAMVAVAGSILQRLTGNEMSSPEVLGISAGATFGVAIGLFAVAPGLFGQFTFAIAGAIAVLAVIFLSSRRSGFSPERVLLAGIALSAMVDAVVGVLSSTGDYAVDERFNLPCRQFKRVGRGRNWRGTDIYCFCNAPVAGYPSTRPVTIVGCRHIISKIEICSLRIGRSDDRSGDSHCGTPVIRGTDGAAPGARGRPGACLASNDRSGIYWRCADGRCRFPRAYPCVSVSNSGWPRLGDDRRAVSDVYDAEKSLGP